MRKLLLVLALVAAMAGVGAAIAIAKGKTKTVQLGDNYFFVGTVKIHKGAKVRWQWSTNHAHNITSKKGDKFKSKTGKSGSFTHTFKTKGTFTIICTKHPAQMRMKVKVV